MMTCTITSHQKTTVYQDVQSVVLPAFSGQMQVLPGHAESFILLRSGSLVLRQAARQDEIIQIVSGECHVKDNALVVVL